MVATIKIKVKYLAIALMLLLNYNIKAQQSNPVYTQNTFKVLTYNVWEGFKGADSAKVAGFKDWIKTLSPDIIALQEMNKYTPVSLKKLADEMGYSYSVIHKENGFPIALISRFPIQNIKKVTTGMTHGFLYGKIKDYHVFVAHLDPKSYQQRQIDVRRLLLSVDSVPASEKVMIMGDFNNMSPQDADDYNNDSKMSLVRSSERNHPETHVLNESGDIDYSAIKSVIDHGFTDSWKLLNSKYEISAPTKVRTHKNYTRIDYIWVNKTLKTSCLKATIIKDDFTDYLSDHYPMYLILKNE